MKSPRTLRALFSMPGFVARGTLGGVFGDRYVRVITLRRQKTAVCSHCGHRCRSRYDQHLRRVRDLSVADWRIYLQFERWRVQSCS